MSIQDSMNVINIQMSNATPNSATRCKTNCQLLLFWSLQLQK